jgi:hypothetical protein
MNIYLTSNIGACMCAYEPKRCAHGLFLIVGCILEIRHRKTKYSLNMYLTIKNISAISEYDQEPKMGVYEPKTYIHGLLLIEV